MDKLSVALGHVKTAYLALSAARNILEKDEKLGEAAKLACKTANALECDILKIFIARKKSETLPGLKIAPLEMSLQQAQDMLDEAKRDLVGE